MGEKCISGFTESVNRGMFRIFSEIARLFPLISKYALRDKKEKFFILSDDQFSYWFLNLT